MRMMGLALVAAVLVASACGAERTRDEVNAPLSITKTAVDPEEPCALLSPAGVENAIETEVRSEREVYGHDRVTEICSYKTTEPWASISVVLERGVTGQGFDNRARRDAINTEVIDGVGDAAFIHGCGRIDVLVGDAVVELSVQHLTTCHQTAVVLRALGHEAVGQLGSG